MLDSWGGPVCRHPRPACRDARAAQNQTAPFGVRSPRNCGRPHDPPRPRGSTFVDANFRCTTIRTLRTRKEVSQTQFAHASVPQPYLVCIEPIGRTRHVAELVRVLYEAG